MPEPKTRPTPLKVRAWLAGIPDDTRRKDCATLMTMMKAATGVSPELWGTTIVGFGRYPMTYASGKTLDWPVIGFASRQRDLVLHLLPGFAGYDGLLKRLGPHRTGKSCLYLKRLSDLDLDVLEALVAEAVKATTPKRGRAASRG